MLYFFWLLFFRNYLRFNLVLDDGLLWICNNCSLNCRFLDRSHILYRRHIRIHLLGRTFCLFWRLGFFFWCYCFLFFNGSCEIGLFGCLLLFMYLWCFNFFLLFLDLNILFFDLSHSWLVLCWILSLFLGVYFNFSLLLLCFLLFVCLFMNNFWNIFMLNYLWSFFLDVFLYCLLVFLCGFYYLMTLSWVILLFFLLVLSLLLFMLRFFLMLFQLLFWFNGYCFRLSLIFLNFNLWLYFFNFLFRLLFRFRSLLMFRDVFLWLFFFMFFFLR